MTSVEEVLRQCEKTASWYGLSISSLDQKNNLGDTPLHTVCTWGEPEAVRTLIDAGSNVNALGDMDGVPLFNAINGRSADVVKLLLTSGANPNIKNSWGDTPLQYAQKIKAPSAIVELLRRAQK